jgi:hypothetical protein
VQNVDRITGLRSKVSVAGFASFLGVRSWKLVLLESGEWKHIAVVPASSSGSGQRLAEKEMSLQK